MLSSSIGDYLTNRKAWGPVMYNVLENKLVGDGVTDDTAALQTLVNKAIEEGRKAIFFPHTPSGGKYYVTALTNTDQVMFFGDNSSFIGGYGGTIRQLGDIAENAKIFSGPNNPTQSDIDAMKSGDLFIVYGAEYTKPTVVSASPANGEKIQTTSKPNIKVTFNTPMKETTISAFKVYPTSVDRNAGTNAIAGTITQSGDGLSWTFIPAIDLTYLNTYYLRITTAAQSAGGAALASDYDSSFVCGRGTYSIKPIIGYLYDNGEAWQWGGFELGITNANGASPGLLGFGFDLKAGAGTPVYAYNSNYQSSSGIEIPVTRTIGWRKWEFRPLTGELLLDDVVRYTHPTARRVTKISLVVVNNTQPIYVDDVTTEDFVDGFESGLDTARWGSLVGGITTTTETTIKHSGTASAKLVGAAGFNFRSYSFAAK